MQFICKNCGTKLFEQEESGNRKIFRSFATQRENGFEYYLCINCHENKNVEMVKSLKENKDGIFDGDD